MEDSDGFWEQIPGERKRHGVTVFGNRLLEGVED